tara:strand:+ start:108 stop:512 length:405 start_codon:yes stop_codon:yes gene_type:complete
MMEGNESGRPASMMSFMDAVKSGFTRMSDFSGRSSRSEYWWLYLGGMIFQVLCFILTALIHEIFLLPILLLIPIFLSVSIRRLHDCGKSGWMLLIGIIPIVNLIGGFVLLYWFIFHAGEPQENAYGAVPTNMLE